MSSSGVGGISEEFANATYQTVRNVLGAGLKGDGTTNDGPALTTLLAACNPGDIVYFPRGAAAAGYLLNGGPFTVPDDVALIFAKNVAISVTTPTGLFLLGNRSGVEGTVKITGPSSGSTEVTAIDLGTSKTDQRVDGPAIISWVGTGVYGVASTRAVITNVHGTVAQGTGGNQGLLVRLTTGAVSGWNGVGDVVSPTVAFCAAVSCGGTGIQLDGDWNSTTWRTAGYKVREATVTGCSGTGCGGAGIFVNSGFDGVITACHGWLNTDYGVGIEYCSDTTLTACTGRQNSTYGVALENNGQNCAIVGCTAAGNTDHGLYVNYNSAVIAGDTAGSGNAVVGCSSRGNAQYGLTINGNIVGTVVSGNNLANGNGNGPLLDQGVGTVYEATTEAWTTGYWHTPATGSSIGTFTLPDGQMFAAPLAVPASTYLTGIGINVQAAGSTGAVIRLGIYADAAGEPGALVLDAGTVAATATGAVSVGIGTTVGPGTYWLCAVLQGAPATAPGVYATQGSAGVANNSLGNITQYGSVGVSTSASTYTGALPATFPGFNPQGTFPRVAVSA